MNTSKRPPLDVARAAKLNSVLRIDQVLLFHLDARQVGPAPATPAFRFSSSFEQVVWSRGPEGIVALFPLKVVIRDGNEVPEVSVAEITVGMRILYRHSSEQALSDALEFVDDYVGIVGWMHAWPYVRAEVQGITARMGLPPLVLPVLLAGQTVDVAVIRIDGEDPVSGRTNPRQRKPKAPKGRRVAGKLGGH